MTEPVFTSALAGKPAPAGLSISIREIADRGMIDLRGDAADPAFRAAVESALAVPLPTTPRTSSSTGDAETHQSGELRPPAPGPSPQGGGEQSALLVPSSALVASHPSSPSPSTGEDASSSSSPLTGEGRGGGGLQARPPKAGTPQAPTSPVTILWLSLDQWLILCPRAETSRTLAELRARLGVIHFLAVDLSDARTLLRLEGDGVREVLMKGSPVDLTLPEYKAGNVRRLRFGEVAALIHIVSERPDTIDLYVFRSYAEFAWDWLLATARAPAKLTLFGAQAAPL